MPFIFIHGVNTRKTDEGFQVNIEARDAMVRRLLLNRLAERGDRFSNIEILNPYWGDDGVDFKWKFATLPDVKTLEHLGAEDASVPADLEFAETARSLATRDGKAPRLEQLGAADGLLKAAAQKDLTRFLESVLSPILLSEMRLADDGAMPPKTQGLLEALLAEVVYDVSVDPAAKNDVATATTDDEVMERLKLRTQARLEVLARRGRATPPPTTTDKPLESLGPGWWEDLKEEVGEIFDRARDAPGRVASIPVLDWKRDRLHRNIARFLGDVFHYLKERGDKAQPGPIASGLVDTIRSAPKNHPDEPTIVMTHSMGGNVLYDILTYYAPICVSTLGSPSRARSASSRR